MERGTELYALGLVVVQRRDTRVANTLHLDPGELVGRRRLEVSRVPHLAALREYPFVVRDAALDPRRVDREADAHDGERREQGDERNERALRRVFNVVAAADKCHIAAHVAREAFVASAADVALLAPLALLRVKPTPAQKSAPRVCVFRPPTPNVLPGDDDVYEQSVGGDARADATRTAASASARITDR